MHFHNNSEFGILAPDSVSNNNMEEQILEEKENDNVQLLNNNSLQYLEVLNINNNNLQNNNQQYNENNNNTNNNNENILGDISNQSEPSSIAKIDESGVGSLLNILEEMQQKEIIQTLNNMIEKGFIPFFIKLEGYKPQFIYAKKSIKFLKVIEAIQNILKINDKFFYYLGNSNDKINKSKTIENLEIEPLNIIVAKKS